MAAQALLMRELTRLGPTGRTTMIKNWALFLPLSLDPTLSIFGARTLAASTNAGPSPSAGANSQPPPVPPRGKNIPLPNAVVQG